MRRQLVASAAQAGHVAVRHLLAQLPDFAQQQVDLPLLVNDDLIQLIELVFVKAGLDLKIDQTLFDFMQSVHTLLGLNFHCLGNGPGWGLLMAVIFDPLLYNFSFNEKF